MKKVALASAIATLGLSSVTGPTAYANGTGHNYHGAGLLRPPCSGQAFLRIRSRSDHYFL